MLLQKREEARKQKAEEAARKASEAAKKKQEAAKKKEAAAAAKKGFHSISEMHKAQGALTVRVAQTTATLTVAHFSAPWWFLTSAHPV